MPDSRVRYSEGDGAWLTWVEPLWEQLRDHHADLAGRFEQQVRARTFAMRLADLTDKAAGPDNIRVIFATDDAKDVVAGYLVATVDRNGRGELDSLYVRHDYRKQGIGSALFERGLAWLRERNADPIHLSVMVGNEQVMSLYARYGFVPRNVVMALADKDD